MIAKYPPMGWNSWDCYGAAVTEDTVRKNADYMAKYLKPYGWEYVVVDIQWYQPTAENHQYIPFSELAMDEWGRLTPAENRFPSARDGRGFAPLAEYVHSLGLKFGIHIMRGMPRMAAHRRLPIAGSAFTCDQAADPHSICAWNPDMYGLKCGLPAARAYYDSIFQLYAQWGVDYVKCDDVAREYPHCKKEIEVISAACRAAFSPPLPVSIAAKPSFRANFSFAGSTSPTATSRAPRMRSHWAATRPMGPPPMTKARLPFPIANPCVPWWATAAGSHTAASSAVTPSGTGMRFDSGTHSSSAKAPSRRDPK